MAKDGVYYIKQIDRECCRRFDDFKWPQFITVSTHIYSLICGDEKCDKLFLSIGEIKLEVSDVFNNEDFVVTDDRDLELQKTKREVEEILLT